MPEVRLIDANALYNDLKESVKAAREWKEEAQDEEIKIRAEQAHGTFCECALRVKNAPTIESEPVRHGRWIVHTTWNGMFGLIHSECSECKFDRNGDLSSWKFCPNCGAKMDLPEPPEVTQE